MIATVNSQANQINHADLVLAQGRLVVSGNLDFANAPKVLEKSLQLMPQCVSLHFDFSQLSSANSVVLALIIEWVKYAGQMGKSIRFEHLSEKIISIAKAAGVEKMLVH